MILFRKTLLISITLIISDLSAQERSPWPVLKTYRGKYLNKVAMPLGGIGTGTVSIGGKGNLQDWELQWFDQHGGVLGIIFMNYWISPVDTPLGLKYIERTLEHAMRIGGSDIVGIGTDFDGFTDPPDEITDMSELPRITRYLASLTSGLGTPKYSDNVLSKFLGGNALRVLREGWK